MFKVIYDKPMNSDAGLSSVLDEQSNLETDELQAIEDLMELWEEGHTDSGALLTPPWGGACPWCDLPPPPFFRPKSWTLPLQSNNHNIWAFVEQTTKENNKLDSHISHNINNPSVDQKMAIKCLQNNALIIIKPADKGGNVVLMNTDDYETMI